MPYWWWFSGHQARSDAMMCVRKISQGKLYYRNSSFGEAKMVGASMRRELVPNSATPGCRLPYDCCCYQVVLQSPRSYGSPIIGIHLTIHSSLIPLLRSLSAEVAGVLEPLRQAAQSSLNFL